MPVWNQQEDETIGFTHPFHNDLRSRGHGMVNQTETGYGHDLTGWEFYKATKVAYGTVIINGTRYDKPGSNRHVLAPRPYDLRIPRWRGQYP